MAKLRHNLFLVTAALSQGCQRSTTTDLRPTQVAHAFFDALARSQWDSAAALADSEWLVSYHSRELQLLETVAIARGEGRRRFLGHTVQRSQPTASRQDSFGRLAPVQFMASAVSTPLAISSVSHRERSWLVALRVSPSLRGAGHLRSVQHDRCSARCWRTATEATWSSVTLGRAPMRPTLRSGCSRCSGDVIGGATRSRSSLTAPAVR